VLWLQVLASLSRDVCMYAKLSEGSPPYKGVPVGLFKLCNKSLSQ